MIEIILCAISAMFLFNIMNQYSAKNIHGIFNALKYSIITLPLQVIAYLLLVIAFSKGFEYFESKYWVISLIVTFASYTTNLIVAYLMFHQIPVKGQFVGFVLMFTGAIIATLWR